MFTERSEMTDATRGWLVLLPDLTPDWKSFMRYWMRERAAAERQSRQAGIEAFDAQKAAASVLLEAAWAERAHVEAVRKAEERHERQAASREHRRPYNAAWMREYRASKRAVREAVDARRASK
jgi:hypothetical protein